MDQVGTGKALQVQRSRPSKVHSRRSPTRPCEQTPLPFARTLHQRYASGLPDGGLSTRWHTHGYCHSHPALFSYNARTTCQDAGHSLSQAYRCTFLSYHFYPSRHLPRSGGTWSIRLLPRLGRLGCSKQLRVDSWRLASFVEVKGASISCNFYDGSIIYQ